MNNPGFHGASQDVSRKKSIAQIVDVCISIWDGCRNLLS